jgi:ABC-2 type transport system ATP-binding protein
MPDSIVIRGVTKTFGTKVAVDHLDLTVPEGSLYGFIGPNGAGKSTTIRMIMSIFFPDRGEISVLGKKSAVESKDRIGYLPEERGLYRKMRVGAFLQYMARLKGIDSAGLETKVRDWLGRIGLGDVYRKRCQELSKGMQQKVQFLSAIMHDPDLIILDEPFSGLDPVNSRLLREMIHERHQKGRTVIFSTHVMAHAEIICDHVVMINRGKKVLDMTLDELRTQYDPKTIIVEPLNNGLDGGSLERLRGVRRVRREGAVLEAALDESADPSAMMRTIFDLAPMRRIERKRVSLEDVFIDIVLGHEGPEYGDGGEEALRASLKEGSAAEGPVIEGALP